MSVDSSSVESTSWRGNEDLERSIPNKQHFDHKVIENIA